MKSVVGSAFFKMIDRMNVNIDFMTVEMKTSGARMHSITTVCFFPVEPDHPILQDTSFVFSHAKPSRSSFLKHVSRSCQISYKRSGLQIIVMELVIEITDRCNNNCIHCSSGSDRTKTSFLPVRAIEKTIASVNPEKVILSGGEPFLHPDIGEIINIVTRENGAKIAADTSGAIFPESIPGNAGKIDEFYVSFFQRAGAAITRTTLASPCLDTSQFIGFIRNKFDAKNIWLNVVVMNEQQAVDVPFMAYKLGMPVHLMRLVNHGRAMTCMKPVPVDVQHRIAASIMGDLDPALLDNRIPGFLIADGENAISFSLIKQKVRAVLERIYPRCKMSHALAPGECRSKEKRTLLPDGRLIGCVAGKGRDETIGKYRACD